MINAVLSVIGYPVLFISGVYTCENKMELETANSISASEATEADIERCFKDDLSRGEFVILTKEDGNFLQAAGEMQGPFIVEYREVGIQYVTTRELSKSETKEIFLEYLRGGNEWKTSYEWKKIELKKGCSMKTVLFVIFAVSACSFFQSITF